MLLLVYSAGVYVGRHPTIGNDRREARRDGNEELKLTAISEYNEGQQWTSIPALPAGYNQSISKYIWTTAASIASVEHQTRAGRSLDTARVKISPKHPVVLEGHPIRLVCVVMQTLRNNASAAPFMTFELPSMNSKDKRTVKLFLRPGRAVLMTLRPGRAVLVTLRPGRAVLLILRPGRAVLVTLRPGRAVLLILRPRRAVLMTLRPGRAVLLILKPGIYVADPWAR